MIYLLDVNVLLAVALPEHMHHAAARQWFLQHREQGWATCPITQSGFVRVSSKPSAGINRRPEVALGFLEKATADAHHHFWPQDRQSFHIHAGLRKLMIGPAMVTDFELVDLALRHGGKLATYDARLARTLEPHAELAAGVELLPDPFAS